MHNGQFRIQQRGGGPFSASGYTVDRWKLGFSTTGGACSVAPNPYSAALASQGMSDERAESVFTYITNAGSQGAGDFSTLGQNIEDARRLSGQTVTLSFWAWANIAGTKLGVEFVQNFGTGGSPSAQITGIGAQAVTLANTPTRYAITVSIPSAVGRTFGTAGGDFTQLVFWLSSGSTNASRASNIGFQSGTFNFWGVQLEYGSVATPLEVRDPQIEVALCQRFYQVLAGFQASGYAPSAGATPGSPIILPVMMRVTPTVAVTNTAFSAASAVSIFPQTGSTATTILTATAGPTVAWATFNAAFSADL